MRKQHSELRKTLAELFQQYQPALERYQWPMESLRWNELVFSVLEALGSQHAARTGAKALIELNLLDVDRLASVHPEAKYHNETRRQLVLGILREAGFGDPEARLATTALAQLAFKVYHEQAGHIQRLLRHESETMVRNIAHYLDVADLGAANTHQIATRWLQNVLNLPVYLDTEAMRAFCASMHAKPSDLVAVADELDINMAILDDLIQMWYQAETERRALAHELEELAPAAGPHA